MSLLTNTFTPIKLHSRNLRLQLIVALVYVVSALVGQQFAIPPGNITPIWLPSGIMLALAIRYGAKIWPGIFLGAFCGNVWAYFSLESLGTAASSIMAGTLNGIGDVLAIVSMMLVIKKLTEPQSPFASLKNFSYFLLFGAILGPAISAVFGVTGLLVFGFIETNNYLYSMSNWLIGDAVGVLLLAPLVNSFLVKAKQDAPYFISSSLTCAFISALATASLFGLITLDATAYKFLALILPVGFALMLFSGQRTVYVVQLAIVVVAVLATNEGKGPFAVEGYLSPLMSLQMFIAVFSMIVFSIALLVEQKRVMYLELEEKKQELESLYRHDKLTGLWNRYRIEEYLQVDLDRFQRSGKIFSVFMLDLDDFKKVNDSYGHLEGDRILIEFSKILQENTRAGDLVGRWGGEEFIIIATGADQANSIELANKLVKLTANHDFQLNTSVTISIGLTLCKPGDDIKSIIRRADKGLYQAKSKGKNQACFIS